MLFGCLFHFTLLSYRDSIRYYHVKVIKIDFLVLSDMIPGILQSLEITEYLCPSQSAWCGWTVQYESGRVCWSCYRWSLWLLLWALTLLSAIYAASSPPTVPLSFPPYGEPPADTVCGGSFQVCRIQASGFQVRLANVFVSGHWSVCWSSAGGEVTLHDVRPSCIPQTWPSQHRHLCERSPHILNVFSTSQG